MAAIYERNLNEDWLLHLEAPARTIPTKVPCSVLNDLVSACMIEEPYYRDNELKALPLMERDYTYTRLIDVPQALLDRGRILLRFEGIDTLEQLQYILDPGSCGRSYSRRRHTSLCLEGRRPRPVLVVCTAGASSGPNTARTPSRAPQTQCAASRIFARHILCSDGTGALDFPTWGYSAM